MVGRSSKRGCVMKSIEYSSDEASQILREKGYNLQEGRSPVELWRVYDKQKGFVGVAYTTGRILPQGKRPEALLEILGISVTQ